MQNIDPYSYQCGVIDCFNEMVRSGVKALALSHPMDSAACLLYTSDAADE